jgi:dTDP-4-amino-4,6-dideoxygalactose transaminase
MSFLPFTRPSIDEQTIASVVESLRSGWLATGPKVARFEQAVSDYLGGRPVRTFTSATEGLEIALKVAGIGPGDEVIVPAMSFVASANVIVRVGAKPVFVDVELDSKNLSPEQVQRAITPRTRAIMPVHFAGLPCDLNAVYSLAEDHGLRVIEDAAHAIGSRHQGRLIGSYGDLVVFSFHPNKNMTSIEGGAISFPGPEEIETVELERFHGLKKDDLGHMDALLAGGKSNLSDIAAAVGLGQLERLEAFNQRRLALATRYFDRLASQDLLRLPARGDSGHSWHIFAPLLQLDRLRISRAEFIQRMRSHDIGVGVHYPAMHLFSVYREQGWKAGDFPNSERIGEQTVTLPLFPAMRDDDVDRSCAAIDAVLTEARR